MRGSTPVEKEMLKVGIAEYKIASYPQSLMTIGLGSCVGIAIYDPVNRIGGLSHIMLPDSSFFTGEKNPGKFADLAIPLMVEELRKAGSTQYLQAKIAGGASMFSFSKATSHSQIGERNTEAVRRILNDLKIPLLAAETGGSAGRTMWLDLEKLSVCIRAVGSEVKEV